MRELFPFLALYRRYFFRIALGIILATVTLLASIGLLTLSGWFLSGSCLAGIALFLDFNYMLPAGGVRGAAIARTAGRYAERLVSHDTTFRVLASLRTFIFARLIPLSPGKISRFRRAELLNRLVADVDTLDHLYLRLLSPLISGIIAIIVTTVILSFFNVTLALTLGITVFLLLIILPFIFYRLSSKTGDQLVELRSEYRLKLTSYLQSHAELVIFNAIDKERQQLNHIEDQWLENQQKQSGIEAISQGLLLFLVGATLLVVLWLATHLITAPAQSAYIALFAFASLSIFEVLAPVPAAFIHLRQVIASARRVNQVINQEPSVDFPKHAVPLADFTQLRFDSVSFSYPNQPRPAVQDIHFTVNKGEHIALLGKTGCGKSTLLQLITRAYDPQIGVIYINDQPLSSYDEATLRQLVGVVPQKSYLFSHTLRENLRLANQHATDQQLINALQQVGLAYLAENDGLDAWLGDGGRLLSGGEQRRLGIARILLHQSPIILMDEPTEGLDSETEQAILQLIHRYCRDKTLIMVTHRLTGLNYFDHIYVMETSKIIEEGCHDTLLAQKNVYWHYLHSAR